MQFQPQQAWQMVNSAGASDATLDLETNLNGGAGGAGPEGNRSRTKRGRSESPERNTKRPALLQFNSISQSHSPLTPSSPFPLPPTTHLNPNPAQLEAAVREKVLSTDFVRRTGELGLRTPGGEGAEGARTPLEMGWGFVDGAVGLGMAGGGEGGAMTEASRALAQDTAMALSRASNQMIEDVDMCDPDSNCARPVHPLRRSPTSPALSNFNQQIPDLQTPHQYPLHRPHPSAYQQHLALSPRGSQLSPGGGTNTQSMMLLSPPESPRRKASSALSWGGGGGGLSGGAMKGFSMGPRTDCEKCRMKVAGHWGHME